MSQSKAHLSGIRLMIQAALGFSVMALCVKWASRSIPSLEIVFFRSLFGTVMIYALMRAKGVSLLGRERRIMAVRGVSGFIALSLHFYTIAHLPLGTAVLLNYTGPIFAAVLAVFFLGERPGKTLVLLIALSFAGVYLVVGAQIGEWNLMVALGLLSAVFAAVAYVSIRAVKRRDSPLTIVLYFTAISTVGSLFYLPFGFVWPDWKGWLLLLGVGIGSFYGQLWMTISLRRAPASLVSPFIYLTPLLTYFYGALFMGDEFHRRAMLGASLIVLSGALISYLSSRNRRLVDETGQITP